MFYTLGRRAVTSVPRTPRNLLCSSQNTLFRFYSRDKETPVPVITLDKKKEQKTEDTLTEEDFLFADTKQILDADALFAIKKKKKETFVDEEPEFATVAHKYKEAEIQYPGGRTKEDVKIETEQFVEDAIKHITTAHDGDVPFDKELYAQAKDLKIKTFEEYQKFPEFGHDWGRSWVNWSPRGKKRTGHDRRFTSAVIEPFNQYLAPEVTKEHIEQVRELPPGARNHLIIDVRGRMRYKDFQIPGSVNLPLDDISDGVFMFPEDVWKSFYKFDKPKAETKIILLSDNPDDSELAGWLFNFAGYKYTFNYRGGVRDWFGNEFKLVWMKNLTLADITRGARALEGRVEKDTQEDDVDRTPKMSKSQMLTKARELLNEDLPSVYDRRFYGLIN